MRRYGCAGLGERERKIRDQQKGERGRERISEKGGEKE
jgi:hypothetical protein